MATFGAVKVGMPWAAARGPACVMAGEGWAKGSIWTQTRNSLAGNDGGGSAEWLGDWRGKRERASAYVCQSEQQSHCGPCKGPPFQLRDSAGRSAPQTEAGLVGRKGKDRKGGGGGGVICDLDRAAGC